MTENHQSSSLSLERGTGPQDLLLVQRALSGERAAVDLTMQRMGCVVRFTYRLNKTMGYRMPTEALEDVVQQVYVAIWPRMADYAGTSALETWIYGFCRNCLRAEFRRRSTRLGVVRSGEDFHEPSVGQPAPHEQAVQMESLDLLHEELEQLDPADREIVEMRHLEGLSFEQIARQKQLPPSTIKDHCYRALDRIRTRLKRRYGRA